MTVVAAWPSFYKPLNTTVIEEASRYNTWHGAYLKSLYVITVMFHLGHVFTDGPEPTGLRYCVNSASLELVTQEKSDEDTLLHDQHL